MFGRRPQDEATPAAARPASAARPAQASPPPPARPAAPPPAPAPARPAPPAPPVNPGANEKRAAQAKAVFSRIQMGLLERIDASAAAKLSREELQRQIARRVAKLVEIGRRGNRADMV